METKIAPKENSEIEITAEIPAEDFDTHREVALKNLGASVEIAGFRKGHVPANILEKHLGEEAVLSEMAQLAIEKAYINIIKERKIDAIGHPQITITKIAKGNPLEFKAVVAVMPEVKLPDYKKLGEDIFKEKPMVVVTDEDVEKTLEEIRARFGAMNKQDGGEKDVQLPELNDEFAKKLGDFKTIDELKNKLKEGLHIEKEKGEKDKRRMKFLESAIEGSSIELPRILIEGELDRMMLQFEDNVARAGGTLEDYFKQTGKEKSDVRREWESDAKKRVSAQLVLNKIISEEKIIIPEEEMAKELEKMQGIYKDANLDQLHAHIETILSNEKVFKLFEDTK